MVEEWFVLYWKYNNGLMQIVSPFAKLRAIFGRLGIVYLQRINTGFNCLCNNVYSTDLYINTTKK